MALLIAVTDRDPGDLIAGLRARLPDVDIRVWPDCGDPDDVTFVLAWRPPAGLFARLPNLRAVSSLGAGVDGLLAVPDLPAHVALGRVVGPRLAADMAGYLVSVIGGHRHRLDELRAAQRRADWRPAPSRPAPTIGLLGMGALGRRAATAFDALGWTVHAWNRSGDGPDAVTMHRGDRGLDRLAGVSDVLVNLLPLTRETRDILDARLFARMRRDSLLINVGRGEHLVEADLLAALNRNRPARAVLDVFRTEPLPSDHPFWTHPRIRMTPHCAAVTSADEAADIVAESYRRVLRGRAPLGQVDRSTGY